MWSTNQYFLLQPSIKNLLNNCKNLKPQTGSSEKGEKIWTLTKVSVAKCSCWFGILLRRVLKHNLDWNSIYKLIASIALHANRQSSRRINQFAAPKSQSLNTFYSSNLVFCFHIIICTCCEIMKHTFLRHNRKNNFTVKIAKDSKSCTTNASTQFSEECEWSWQAACVFFLVVSLLITPMQLKKAGSKVTLLRNKNPNREAKLSDTHGLASR